LTKTWFWILLALVLLPLLGLSVYQLCNPGQESLGFIMRELLGLWVSVVVGGVVAWYTWETQKLRKAAEEQINLLKMQARRSLLPDLTLKLEGEEQGSPYRFTVSNCSDRQACFVSPFFRKADPSSPKWFVQKEEVPFELPRKNDDNARNYRMREESSGAHHLAERYKIDEQSLLKAFDEVAKVGLDRQSVAGVLFYDVDNNLYVTCAAVDVGSNLQLGVTRTIGPLQ